MNPRLLTPGSWIVANSRTLGRVVHATDDYVFAATATDAYSTSGWFAPGDCKLATGADFTRVTCADRNVIETRYRALIDTHCENCSRSIPTARANWSPDMGYAAGIGFCERCDADLTTATADDCKALRDAIRTALGLLAPLAPTGPLTAAATVLQGALDGWTTP